MNFILISDAVRLTGLDRQTIRNWIDKGIIPAQKISGTFYVDKDTFEALSEQMRDVDGARKRLDEMMSQYHAETDLYRNMREDAKMRRNTSRYMSICVNSGIRTEFFKIILRLMNSLGIISGIEADVLKDLIDGDDYMTVAEKYKTTRDRVRLMAEKAIRKSRDLTGLMQDISEKEAYEDKIRSLKDELAVMKRMVYKKAIDETEANLNDIEKRLFRMDKDELNALLSKRLENEDLSVRAINILSCYKGREGQKPIRTMGDLCRISSADFMQQRNAGKKTLDELTDYLHANGLDWETDIDKIMMIR